MIKYKKCLLLLFFFPIQFVNAQTDDEAFKESLIETAKEAARKTAKEAARRGIEEAAEKFKYELLNSQENNSEELSNISATVGINGKWTFKFYSNGFFKSHIWYGDYGKYSLRGVLRKESFSSGTYTIKDEDGDMVVHLRYANGAKEQARLRYKGERVELLLPYNRNGISTLHKEM